MDYSGVAGALRRARYEVIEWIPGRTERPNDEIDRTTVWLVMPALQRKGLEYSDAEKEVLAAATELIEQHPERAAVALELAGIDEAARLLEQGAARHAAPPLGRMSPLFAADVLGRLEPERIAELIEVLPLDVAARLVRRLPPERAEAALASADGRLARSLRSVLRFPEGSAGALMDPDVMALPETLTASEALERIRERPETARYNIYVVDPSQRLIGVVNLRELLLARPRARLADFMVREPHRLDSLADRSVIVAHPGWQNVHSLPVVDAQGGYLGAVRYRTLRALEDELFSGRGVDIDAPEALGQLFSAGARGLLDALAATPPGGGKR